MSKPDRPVVFLFIDWFKPGFKAGGPIRSMVNFTDQMAVHLDIHVFTSDRDLGDNQPYPGVTTDRWIAQDGFHVYYASPAAQSVGNIRRQLLHVHPDHIYLNSMFSPRYALMPAWLNRNGAFAPSTILAPRGMLRTTAIRRKSAKKGLFLSLFRFMGLHNRIHFQATDQQEVSDIRHYFGTDTRLTLLPNLPGKQPEFLSPPDKQPGELNLIFVGRIHPIKNLIFLLDVLKGLSQRVTLTVVATLEDKEYWKACELAITRLPANITVILRQDVPHEDLERIIGEHHVFTLPTLGENFGHSISEALSVGRPVVISDQTPWRGLEEGRAGHDLSLHDPTSFRDALARFADMSHDELLPWCKGAWAFAQDLFSKSDLINQYKKTFS
jgi:glycosyltransferase involved in cell wall biosynthesis